MIVRRVLLNMVTIILSLSTTAVQAEVAARVAVLPFEVYANASTAYLKDTIAHELSSHLAQVEGIAVVDQTRIKDILDRKTSFSFNEGDLRGITETLEAPFLVLGSMTKIGENLSLDTYVFTTQGTSSFSKDFTEGKNLNALIRKMAQKISSQILVTARTASEGQEPEPSEKPSLSKPAGLTGKATPEEDKPTAFAEQVSTAVVAEEKVHAEVEENTSETGTLPPKTVTAAVADQPHTVPYKGITEEGVDETTTEEGNQLIPEEQVNSDLLKAPAGSAVGDGKTATVTRLPQGKPDRASEQPRTSRKKERKAKSLSSPFSTMKAIQITSKSMEADNKKNIVTFKGNVVVKQEDIVINSDIMKVAYEPKGGISRVEASGNVKMSQENRIATGKKLVFHNPEQKIVLTGNPRIWQGDNLISCEKVTVLLEEDKIFFEGTVDSIIYPKSIQEQDSEKTQQVEAITLPPPDTTSEIEVREDDAIPLREGEGSLQDASR